MPAETQEKLSQMLSGVHQLDIKWSSLQFVSMSSPIILPSKLHSVIDIGFDHLYLVLVYYTAHCEIKTFLIVER